MTEFFTRFDPIDIAVWFGSSLFHLCLHLVHKVNIAAAPSNMAMHYLLPDHLHVHIAVFSETKLLAPAAMYPPLESFGWHPTHIDAQMGSPYAGVLTRSHLGGVTILLRQDVGIVLTDLEVIQDFYGHALIIQAIHNAYQNGAQFFIGND